MHSLPVRDSVPFEVNDLRAGSFLTGSSLPSPGWFLVTHMGRSASLIGQDGQIYKLVLGHPRFENAWSPWKPPAFDIHVVQEFTVSTRDQARSPWDARLALES
jgi:hypothetical protein